ncbi:hypothetical protein D3C71_1206240 [compost metagenome]
MTTGLSWRRQARANTSAMARLPPTMAIHSRPISSKEGANRVTIISASWAPEATPSVVGDARGLRSTCCIRVPASPRAAPASRQTTSRGSQLK